MAIPPLPLKKLVSCIWLLVLLSSWNFYVEFSLFLRKHIIDTYNQGRHIRTLTSMSKQMHTQWGSKQNVDQAGKKLEIVTAKDMCSRRPPRVVELDNLIIFNERNWSDFSTRMHMHISSLSFDATQRHRSALMLFPTCVGHKVLFSSHRFEELYLLVIRLFKHNNRAR
jgi:hypothetical protein